MSTTTTEATMQLSTMTPREIDEILAPLYAERARLNNQNAADRAAADKARTGRIPNPKLVEQLETRIELRNAKIVELSDQAAPFEAEYQRRPWSRAFLALSTPGHVHSDYWCHTLHRGAYYTDTEWRTEYSGLSQEEIIEAAGCKAGTCCYPDAPVTDRPSRIVSKDEEAKQAARQAKEDKRNAKAQAAKADALIVPADVKLMDMYGTKVDKISKAWLAASAILADNVADRHYTKYNSEKYNWQNEQNIGRAADLIKALALTLDRTTEEIITELVDTKLTGKIKRDAAEAKKYRRADLIEAGYAYEPATAPERLSQLPAELDALRTAL